ncbi:MAG: hypothetical protein ACJAVM_000467 [Sulfitobacter sp.]|jgi:hypothetical protein
MLGFDEFVSLLALPPPSIWLHAACLTRAGFVADIQHKQG